MNHPIKPGGRFFQYRNGIEGFYWKGLATKPDLGAQPGDHPRLVVNGRYFGGHIVARPPVYDQLAHIPVRHGLNVVSDLEWAPTFLAEHHSYAGLRLWWGANAPVDVGGACGFVDTDYDPEFNEVAVYNQASAYTPIIERFANYIYVGNYGSLKRLYRIEGMPGSPASYDTLTPSDEIVVTYPGYVTTALFLHEGRLFYFLADPLGAANGLVYSWDGFQSVLEYDTTVAGAGSTGVSMFSFRNTLVVTVRGLGSILVRSATGSWSTATVAGFNSSGYMNSMAEVGAKLYIMNGGDKIYSWDGTSLVLVRTIVGGTAPEVANCCVNFNGRLYYLWAELISVNRRWPWLGVFDPDTVDATYKWKDDYKSFGYQDGVTVLADTHSVGGNHPHIVWGEPTAMAVYRQRIVATIGSEIATVQYTNTITHSIANNPFSSWHITHPNSFVMEPTGPMYYNNQNTGGLGVTTERAIRYLKVL